MYNKPVTVESCVDILEKILELYPHNYHQTTTKITWERGYLTGMLARMMMEDPRLRIQIERIAEDLTMRSKK
jgi:hypothetical protein